MADTTSPSGIGMSGTRVDNPYLYELPCPDMPNQEEPMSCSAACARKLLLDSKIDEPESAIRVLANFHPSFGIVPFDLAIALTTLHPTANFLGGCVNLTAGQSLEQVIDLLSSRGPWIANLHLPDKHSVIVVRLENDLLHILDPWGMDGPGCGSGTRATIAMSEFLQRWQPSLHAIFSS